jgi:hypothetical protein
MFPIDGFAKNSSLFPPSVHASFASTSTLTSQAEVEVKAKLACTLGGNSELFLAKPSIGIMDGTLKDEMAVCDTACRGKPAC